MIFHDFGMDTASLAGSLDTKLAAVREAGFSQVMITAADIVGHPGGTAAGVRAVRGSGLEVTGLEALRDFEGLGGQLGAAVPGGDRGGDPAPDALGSKRYCPIGLSGRCAGRYCDGRGGKGSLWS